MLPQKVVRETIVNAVMHRDYLVKEPILVVRYDDRLETRNAGYSLKPKEQLGSAGSRLRNPTIASVLYDLNFAETKGSGIGVIRHQLKQANLSQPQFISDTLGNSFQTLYLLHQLCDESQIEWLSFFSHFKLTENEIKALLQAKEIGSVNNQTLCTMSELDTLKASRLLSKLTRDYRLLTRCGGGRTTYYVLSKLAQQLGNRVELSENKVELSTTLQKNIAQLSVKARADKLLPIMLEIIALKETTIGQLAKQLNRGEKALRKYLKMLLESGDIQYKFPEAIHHPLQAYLITEEGKIRLKQQGAKK